jgi:hypothetical protein
MKRAIRIPEYMLRIQAAQVAGHFKPGEVYVTEVAHAPNCRFPKSGICVCWPVITAASESEVLTIGTGGHILARSSKQ